MKDVSYDMFFVIYGAYSVMVSTRVCGTFSSGSNPDRRPEMYIKNISILWRYFLCIRLRYAYRGEKGISESKLL